MTSSQHYLVFSIQSLYNTDLSNLLWIQYDTLLQYVT